MTDEQIEKAAQQHANNVNYPCAEYGWYECDDEQMKECLADVFKAGVQYALSHQWISVDERLAEYNTTCLVFGHKDFGDGSIARYTMMAHYDGENFYDAYNDSKYHPEMWMPIPALPKLNPEK